MTTEPFAEQHAIIETAQHRICEAEMQIYAALADIPKPPGATTGYDEWRYCELAGAYTRDLAMGRWDVAGGVCGEVTLFAEQIETGALREWSICLAGHGLDAMTAEDTRRIAAALLEAATALDTGQGRYSDRDDHHPGDDHDAHEDDVHEDDVHEDDVHEVGVHEVGVHEDDVHEVGVHEDGVHEDGVHEDGVHEDGVHEDGDRADRSRRTVPEA